MNQDISLVRPAITSPAARPAARTGLNRRRLIDAPTRALHWWLALSVAVAWLTGDSERWRLVHVCMGYSAAGLFALELLWGWIRLGLAHQPARLRGQFAKLKALPNWWARTRAGQIDLPQGLNLLIALSVVLMLLLSGATLLTGLPVWWEWLADGPGDVLAEVHKLSADALLATIAVHVGALLLTSWQRRRNLLAPMVSGRTDGPGPDLVKCNRTGLALVISLSVLVFWGWRFWLAWNAASV